MCAWAQWGQDGSVRRRLAYLLAWSLATAAIIGTSWLGLRSVLDAAAPQRAPAFSAVDLRPESTPGAIPTTPLASLFADPSESATPPPGPGPSPVGRAPSTPSPEWRPSDDGRGGTGYQRTFHLGGGDVTFWCDSLFVRVVAAVAKPGFAMVDASFSDGARMVSFISPEHVSRVYVAWSAGPYAEVTESLT